MNKSRDAIQSEEIFSLQILSTIKTRQLAHGLRHGDYNRYKVYCMKRIRRIRQMLKVKSGSRFRKRKVTVDMVTDVRYLELVLMLAERAWAHAWALKDEVDNTRAKFHSTRRLAKAANFSKQLLELCNAKADEHTKLEAESYRSWFLGNILLEKEDWSGAVKELIKAKTVYYELSKVGSPAQRELCTERVNEIEPTIRFCDFNLTQSGSERSIEDMMKMKNDSHVNMLQSKLDSVMADVRKKEAEELRQITWRNKSVAITNEKMRLCIVSTNDIFYQIKNVGTKENILQLYDRMMIAYSDAIKLVQTDIAQLRTLKMNQKREEELETLLYIEEYLQFMHVERVYQRNTMLVERIEEKIHKNISSFLSNKNVHTKPDEVVVLYENLIRNVVEMSAIKDFDPDASRLFVAQQLGFKAIRCFYVSLSYMFAEKWVESMALFNRCEVQIRNTMTHYDALPEGDKDKMTSKLFELQKKAQGFSSLAHAKGFLAQQTEKTAEKDSGSQSVVISGTLLDNLHIYDPHFLSSGPNGEAQLIQFPPHFEQITAKPLLFDLAGAHCSFPDLSQHKKAPGWLSGWW